MRFVAFLLLFTLGAARALTQPQNFLVRQYSTENGMPSNGVQGLQWDEESGFLWIATEAGIVRFNGAELKTFTKENTSFIQAERTLFCLRANNGDILSSDALGNLLKVKENRLQLQHSPNNNEAGWGIFRLLNISEKMYRSKMLAKPKVSPFNMLSTVLPINDTSGFTIIRKKINFISLSYDEPKPVANKGSFVHIFKVGKRYFVIDSARRTYAFNPKTTQTTSVPILNEHTSGELNVKKGLFFWEPGMPHAFYFENKKVWMIDEKEEKLSARLLFDGLEINAYIRFVQFSRQTGMLFLGTDSKGIFTIQSATVRTMKPVKNSIEARNSYYSQVELPDGNVLTNEAVIIGTSKPTYTSLPAEGKFAFFTHRLGDSVFLYSQYNSQIGYSCLYKYNFKTKVRTIYPKIEITSQTTITNDSTNVFIINSAGIHLMEADSIRKIKSFDFAKNSLMVYYSTCLNTGILAISGCFGLITYNYKTGAVDSIFQKENYCVRSIWKYKDYLFFGTYGAGFYVHKNGITKQMPLDKRNFLLYTHCFMPDQYGYVWMSTNRGLFKSNLQDLLEAFDKNKTTIYYHYLGKNDGMQMTELNGGCSPCAIQLKNGNISFPSMDGLVWVNPNTAKPVLPEGVIYIDEIEMNGKRFHPDSLDLKRLPSNTGELIFRLTMPAWANIENIYLEYQLNDTVNWKPVKLSPEMTITLSNLPAGKYTLRIRKQNGFGNSNFSYREIRFAIRIPWYKQWWFVILAFISVFGSIISFLELRNRQLQQKQLKLEKLITEKTKELQLQNEVLEKNDIIKTRLISIISHDIITPLKFVAAAARNLVERKKQMPEELQYETVQEMANTAQELQILSTNILNWIKYQNKNRRMLPENIRPAAIAAQVYGILAPMAREKQVHLVNTIDPALEIFQYEEALRILIYNLLTNAINFTEKGTITIGIVTSGRCYELFVKDEGVGMSIEQVANLLSSETIISSANTGHRKGNGLGYLIIKDLLKMMNANISINSKKGKGTIVSIRFNE